MPKIKQRKVGGAWYLYWSEGGEEQRRSLGRVSIGEARDALRLKREELNRARLNRVVQLPNNRMPTFEQFADEYLRWHEGRYASSHQRIRQIAEQYLIPHFGATALDRISKTQTERYMMGRKAKAATIEKELRTVIAILNRALFMEIIAVNPVKGVKPPQNMDSKPPRFFTVDELEAIYSNSKPLAGALPATKSAIPDYAPIWRLLANTGLRRKEALQLKWSDVSTESLRVLSTQRARTKSGKWRHIPLSDGATLALKILKGWGYSTVVPPMHKETLSGSFSNAVERAGLDGSIHCLRHTFCAHLVMSGVPLYTVQKLAGHAAITTTERYAHLSPDYLKDSVTRLKR